MAHAMVYHGKLELNHDRLQPETATFLEKDGHERPLSNSKAGGILFGYMTRGSSDFLVIKAGPVVLDTPVPLRFERHTDGKGVAPRPTQFGDQSARRLLRDIVRANPGRRAALQPLCAAVGLRLPDGVLVREPASGDPGEPPPDTVGPEGRLRLRQHRVRERNRRVVVDKRRDVLRRTGRLACEVCGFDFARAYAGVGQGYCEVHHLVPLSAADGEVKTTPDQLAVVCSNCHRMIHRRYPPYSLNELRRVLAPAT